MTLVVRRAALVFIPVLSLAAVACSSSTTTSTSATTSPPATSSPDTAKSTGTSRTNDTRKTNDTKKPLGGGTDFCNAAAALDDFDDSHPLETGGKTSDTIDPKVLGEFEAALDDFESTAPSSIKDEFAQMRDVFEQLINSREEDLDKVLELLLDPDLQRAVTAVGDAVEEECGFKPTGLLAPDGFGGGGTDPGSEPFTCADIESSFDDQTTDPTSIYSIKKNVCEAKPDAAWGEAILDDASWSVSGAKNPEIQIVLVADRDSTNKVSAEGAVEACTAVVAYFAGIDQPDTTVTIGVSNDDSFKVNNELARRAAGGSCTAS